MGPRPIRRLARWAIVQPLTKSRQPTEGSYANDRPRHGRVGRVVVHQYSRPAVHQFISGASRLHDGKVRLGALISSRPDPIWLSVAENAPTARAWRLLSALYRGRVLCRMLQECGERPQDSFRLICGVCRQGLANPFSLVGELLFCQSQHIGSCSLRLWIRIRVGRSQRVPVVLQPCALPLLPLV